jgi:hypothetical protein
MDEGKINKWVQELIMRRGMIGRLQYIPTAFYRQLKPHEQAEVFKRYKDRARDEPPYRETK